MKHVSGAVVSNSSWELLHQHYSTWNCTVCQSCQGKFKNTFFSFYQVLQLSAQVDILTDGQEETEDNLAQVKHDTGLLSTRLSMLEDQVKQVEVKDEENWQFENRKRTVEKKQTDDDIVIGQFKHR